MYLKYEIFGTELYISPASAITAAVFFYVTDMYVVLAALLSIIVHETGHLLMIRAYKEKIRHISIEPFGLSIECTGAAAEKEKLLCALAGPAAGMLIIIICDFFPSSDFLSRISELSLIFTLVNLLPCLPLDGGNALNSILMICFSDKNAERIMRAFSETAVIFLLLIGIVLIFYDSGLPLILFAVYLIYCNLRDY